MHKKYLQLLSLLCALAFLFTGCYFLEDVTPPPSMDSVEVHFIDVGQGDSILIRSPHGDALIDTGESKNYPALKKYLKDNGVKNLALCVATHPHSDHIGSMDRIVSDFEIEKLIMPDVVHTSATYERLVDAIMEKGLKATKAKGGDSFTIGELAFTVVAPNSKEYDELNNYSAVIKIEYGQTSFLFTGDAEEISENEILSKDFDISADVLKLGHHGSKTSTGENFLKAVSPKYAVIMCGKDNTYGHPTQKILKRLASNNITTYRTDEMGTIIIKTDGNSITAPDTRGK